MRRRMVVVLGLLVVAPFLWPVARRTTTTDSTRSTDKPTSTETGTSASGRTHIPPRGSPERMGVPGRSLTIA
jgi:hypothetical protein